MSNRGIYINDGIAHPIRAFKLAVKRWLRGMADEITVTGSDANGDLHEPDIPPHLQQFQEREVIPLKGVQFRVGKVVGGDFPALILVPTGVTTRHKLDTIRAFRAEVKRLEVRRHVG